MHTINDLFSYTLDSVAVVILVAILMYSYMVKEYFVLLGRALAQLYQYILYCNLKKCSFFYNSKTFICFDITP